MTDKGDGQPVILVVEDEPFIQMLIADFLGELGYTILVANDAKSALASLENERQVHLLLADVGLPDMDGWALADAARTLRPSLPVLFATGYGEESESKLAPGMAVISKPFDMPHLAAKVRSLLARV